MSQLSLNDARPEQAISFFTFILTLASVEVRKSGHHSSIEIVHVSWSSCCFVCSTASYIVYVMRSLLRSKFSKTKDDIYVEHSSTKADFSSSSLLTWLIDLLFILYLNSIFMQSLNLSTRYVINLAFYTEVNVNLESYTWKSMQQCKILYTNQCSRILLQHIQINAACTKQ